MINLQKANDYSKKLFSVNWVKWIHDGTKPAENNLEKTANVLLGLFSKHCAMCLNLNGCCFVKNNCPTQPLHPNCHCRTTPISSISPTSICPIEKIRDYVFSDTKNNGKKDLFESWGYSIMDSEKIKNEIEKQAEVAYSIGEYNLGKLNDYGQRISILTKLTRKNNNEKVSFYSGWMVYPNGKLILTTPYGAK